MAYFRTQIFWLLNLLVEKKVLSSKIPQATISNFSISALLQLSEIAEQLYRATATEVLANVEGDEFISPDQLLVQITRVATCLRAERQTPYQAVLETKKPIQKCETLTFTYSFDPLHDIYSEISPGEKKTAVQSPRHDSKT